MSTNLINLRAGARGSLLVPVATLIGWLGCLIVGTLGFALPYERPRPPARKPIPISLEVLQVELTGEPPPATLAASMPLELSRPPPPIDPLVPPRPPPMLDVAEPLPAIAFALPVERPARIVETREASSITQNTLVSHAPEPPVQGITYGRGEGRQPAPEYPRRAIREGQEGTVTVRFRVGENGKVLTAEAVAPCPWPLLNEAVLRTVKNRWRFSPGRVRLYEVSIRFEL